MVQPGPELLWASAKMNPVVAKRCLMNIGRWIQNQSKTHILLLATFLFLLDEYIDYRTGPELNVSFFHLVPLFLIVWNSGFIPGLFYSFFCSLVIFVVTIQPTFTRPTSLEISNALANLVFFVAFSAVLGQLKKYLEKVTFMAEIDGLTNLLNARSFYQRADREVRVCAQSGRPFTVLYLDVDNFKEVNDSFGHTAGDEILKKIGKVLNAQFRKNDLRARIGGDEFAVLLPGFSKEEATIEIPQFHALLNQALRETKGTMTCSLGAVTFLQAPPSAKDALHEADMLMYRVKMGGKNSFLCQTSIGKGFETPSTPERPAKEPVETGKR